MNIVNHTPFPAQAFAAVDQHGQQFHVFVLRQTLSFASGQLEYADKQLPLCEADSYFGEGARGGVRQESDYCPYKPKCDVIVNATAHAPKGKAVLDFPVRLRVWRPGAPKSEFLIDKTLTISGARQFKKKAAVLRLLNWVVKCCTLTLIRLNPWKLGRAQAFTSLPVRHESSYGGQCRINNGDAAARRLATAQRLTPAQLAGHPDVALAAPQQPAAHAVFEPNPAGLGYAPGWYLKATGLKAVAAPCIERLGAACTAKQFWHLQQSSKQEDAAPESAGFGIRGKSHPARRALLGAVDDAFVQSDAALPSNFDFGIWNAAPADQQIDFPRGDEVFELVNLCRPDTPGASVNQSGNAFLQLRLLEHECFLLVRLQSGDMFMKVLEIDTVIVEPDELSMTLVWRTSLAKVDDVVIRASEFRMRTIEEGTALRARAKEFAELSKEATE
ncbi:hypothetical protein CSQ96_12185 [Janthinobacterium sp. BJB412]|nr:hypothetical protein CSQ96_12185 [Janthinobacterium sp. BJB412]